MCSDPKRIQSEVSERIQRGEPFTAWNVTVECRKPKGGSQGMTDPHRDIKKEVHNLFSSGQMSNYIQELVQVPNTTAECFLYLPPGMDPKDAAVVAYVFANGPAVSINDPAGATQSTPQTSQPTVPQTTAAPASASPAPAVASAKKAKAFRPKTTRNSDGSVVKDVGTLKGSALYVPKDMVAKAGISPNGAAFATVSQGSPHISISVNAKSGTAKKVCVDCNGNVRIGTKALLKAGFNGKVKVEMDGSEILLSKA